MPLLYLAKINLNSRIFDYYNNNLDIKDVSQAIYDTLTDGINYSRKENRTYTDTYGNPISHSSVSKYAFQEIIKKDKKITGKLVRTFTKQIEQFDEETNKMITVPIKESVSISFYYDVFSELLTFCERQAFGYNQFMNAFAHMLHECTKNYEFEIFLQKDKNLLNDKLKEFKSVKVIKAKLIPPNINDDDINEIRSELNYMIQCEETNSRKIYMEYTSDDMNMESNVIKEIINASSRGYGEVTAEGINKNDKLMTVKSREAAFTINIKDNLDNRGFIDESKNLIERFLSNNKYTKNFYRRD